MPQSEILQVEMPNGRMILVEARVSGEEKVASAVPKFSGLSDAITEVAQIIAHAIEETKPASAEIEFGIEAAVESGRLTALLVKGTGTANLKVTLKWGVH